MENSKKKEYLGGGWGLVIGFAKNGEGDFLGGEGEVLFKVMQQVVLKEHSKTFNLKFICIYIIIIM